jgi:tripartite ATP-independent transporter DctP family solute receptor
MRKLKLVVAAFMLIAFHQCLRAEPSKTAPSKTPPPKTQPPIELRLGHVAPAGSIYDLTANEFARRVKEKLHGRVTVTVIPDSKLGNDPQLLDKVRHGELDFALPAPATSSISPMFSVFDVPYLVLTREHVRNSREVILKKYFQPAAHAQGLVILGMWENGFRHLTNNVRPIHSPQDLKGLKIRVPQGSRFLTALKGYGAEPGEYPFGPPLVQALKDGKFDGQENPFTLIRSLKMDEVQKYLSLTSHIYMPVYLTGNEKKIGALPPDVQAVLKKTGADLQDWSMSLGEALEVAFRLDLSRTMAVNEIDTLSFLAASLPAYKQFAAEVPQGKELIRLLYDKSSFAAATHQTWQ